MPVEFDACNGTHIIKREHRRDAEGGVSLHDADEWDIWRAGYIKIERLLSLEGAELDDFIAEGPDGIAAGTNTDPATTAGENVKLAEHLAEAVTNFLGSDQDTQLAHIFEGDRHELQANIRHTIVSALIAPSS